MLVKDISYVDPFTEQEVTRKYYFNLTKGELLELEKSVDGDGFSGILQKIISENRNNELIPYFKKIIALSVGDRLEDGSFVKTDLIKDRFLASEAYSNLLMSLFDAEELVKFVKGIMPKDIMTEVEKELPEGLSNTSEIIKKLDAMKDNSNASKNSN